MKTRLLCTCLYLLVFVSFGQNKNASISNKTFEFKRILVGNENGDSSEQVEIYRNGRKLVSHTLSLIEGDCNSESIQLGTWEIRDNKIILYTYWARTGDAPVSPYGFRKQIYSVDDKNHLKFFKGIIYIETSRKGWPDNKGMAFLFRKPVNKTESGQLSNYILNVEKEYQATFVRGTAKDALLKEVSLKLRNEIAVATKGWQE